MSPEFWMIASVFVQVGLTIWAIATLGLTRIKELKKREIPLADIAIQTTAYPKHIQLLEKNASNQFELPVLFFACVCLSVALGISNWLIAASCAIFVISRLAHRYVHVTSNRLQTRFKTYVVGMVAICLMWLVLAFELLLG